MQIKYVNEPSSYTTVIGNSFDVQSALTSGKVDVIIHNNTKTRLSISLWSNETSANVNIIPEGSEKFKFHAETKLSYWTYKNVTNNYFVITSKQNIDALEEHIKNIVKQIFKTDDMTVNIWVNRATYPLVKAKLQQAKQAA